MRVGSLCTGYGGMEIALENVFGNTDLRWVADNDPDCVTILEKRFPGVANLGDLKEICYNEVEPVDLLAAGFPCTDVSLAGTRKGLTRDTRTGLWYEVARAIDSLRPPLVFIENVPGLLSGRADGALESCPWCLGDESAKPALRALGAVLGDLSSLGYSVEWTSVRASHVGAPHRRERVFLMAAEDPDSTACG
jgi:DNA (cytosine-5)-methyltransferase 1